MECDFCAGGYCGLCTLPQCDPSDHLLGCHLCQNCRSCGAQSNGFCITCNREGDPDD